MSCGSDTAVPPVSSDPRIDNDADDEEWMPNLPFDSNTPMWNDEESEDDIQLDSENEEDFLDKIVEEKPGVNLRKYRNQGWYVALMRMAIEVGDDPLDEDWVSKKGEKEIAKWESEKDSECVWDWPEMLLNEQYGSRRATAVFRELRWCIWMQFLINFC